MNRESSVETENTVKVVFNRPQGRWNQQRTYHVWVDEIRLCKLRRGQEREVELPVGRHVVRATVANTGSAPVELVVVPASPPVRIRVSYAGTTFLFSALSRGLTLTRWLDVVPDSATAQET
jgi:hypothetical protein